MKLEAYFKSIIDADTAAVVCNCSHKIPVTYFASVNFPGTLYPMGWASALGSLLSVVICVTAYAILNRKKAVEKLG